MLVIRESTTRKRFKKLETEWSDCQRCPLHHRRSKVVQARGVLPCEVAFFGEAPGRSEDSAGYPFVGRAGSLLNSWIAYTLQRIFHEQARDSYTYAIFNTVGCMPEEPDLDGGWKLRPPTPSEMDLCSPRVKSLLLLANPDVIVILGKTAAHILPVSVPYLLLPHPAYVLRKGGENSLDHKRVCMILNEFLSQHLHHPNTRKASHGHPHP
jgi:uracil-DNA glycosylase family 4